MRCSGFRWRRLRDRKSDGCSGARAGAVFPSRGTTLLPGRSGGHDSCAEGVQRAAVGCACTQLRSSVLSAKIWTAWVRGPVKIPTRPMWSRALPICMSSAMGGGHRWGGAEWTTANGREGPPIRVERMRVVAGAAIVPGTGVTRTRWAVRCPAPSGDLSCWAQRTLVPLVEDTGAWKETCGVLVHDSSFSRPPTLR